MLDDQPVDYLGNALAKITEAQKSADFTTCEESPPNGFEEFSFRHSTVVLEITHLRTFKTPIVPVGGDQSKTVIEGLVPTRLDRVHRSGSHLHRLQR